MVDHFHEQVIARTKIGGKARAMVVTSGIERAIQYKFAHSTTTWRSARARTRPSWPSPASTSYGGEQGDRSQAERLPERDIPDKFQEDPYRFLIVRRQVPDRLRRAAAAHDVRGQGAVGHQGGADAVAAEPGPPRRSTIRLSSTS